MLVVLSMTMATQYGATKIGYSYSVVHPSNADVRFIGADNSSDDGNRVLRVDGSNASGQQSLKVELGNWAPNQFKNYTAAFGIVNEEGFAVNITHATVNGTGTSYMDIWLHANRTTNANDEPAASKVLLVDAGSAQLTSSNCAWVLAAGNSNANNMCADGSTQLTTGWDGTSHVRYYVAAETNASVNSTSDFVWVQISLDLPSNAAENDYTGTIWIHFEASTIT
jgi:hypothetical protein